ncbi:MAG: acyl-CoA thioesterase [Deltaproteobacteria bacterium]|nr:acyl-CoA thioesterase [Deltaproteobacteria bacterium]
MSHRTFVQSYKVRFGEIDHAGVMYYPAFFDRMHRAFEDFWEEALGRSYAEVLDGDGIGFPVVDIHSRFSAPFRLGDIMRVEIAALRLGGRSITFRYQLFKDDEDAPRTEAEIVSGVIAMGTFEPQPLPDHYRAALTPYVIQEAAPS